MIYVTGDTHGDINRFRQTEKNGNISICHGDYLIICGDFGFIFDDDDVEKEWLNELEHLSYTILWIDGNHENFRAINKYPVELWNGGKIHRIRKNILHLMRGQVFVVEGYKIFTMGGAYSIDRYLRQEDVSYWKEELPTDEEYKEAVLNLYSNDKKVDIIISHTAPKEIIRMMGYYPDRHDEELTGFLEWVMHECKYNKWYFGHWHEDRVIADNFIALYFEIEKV